MRLWKQSDTSKVIFFYMVDSTDHVTEETGLTLTVTVSKNGAAFGAVTGTVAEVATGTYKLTPSAADVGILGPTVFRATATGADSFVVEGCVVAFDPFDAVRMGQSALPNADFDAPGGLPISDAGGLDLDSKLSETNEITAARMGALTDWIDGGRLDLLLDAIPTTPMRGTDGANTTVPDAAGTAAALHSTTDGLITTVDTVVDALPTLAEILAGGDIDGYTLEETLKLCLASLAGKLSGAATTTITIRAADDSKDRLTATVDASGNRSAITYDATG